MFAFEAVVTVINESSSELEYSRELHADNSTWVVPPTDVPNDGKGYTFRLVSNEPLLKLEGVIYYGVQGGQIALAFACPAVGDNVYLAQSTEDNFGAKGDGDVEGNVCNITYHVYNK